MDDRRARRAARGWTVLVLVLAGLLAPIWPLVSPADAQSAPADYALPASFGAHFFTQAGRGRELGFAVSNADGISLLASFQQLGGAGSVGYPVSHRFRRDGQVAQAFQRLVLQWRPGVGIVYLPPGAAEVGPIPAAALQPLPASSAPLSAIATSG
jgi:hypothetical protein